MRPPPWAEKAVSLAGNPVTYPYHARCVFRCSAGPDVFTEAIFRSTDSRLLVVRGEITRIRQDLRQWREEGDGLERMLAGWGGVVFTMTMVLCAGYGSAETIDDILGIAITPLAVLWGLQHYPRTQPPRHGNPTPDPEVGAASTANPEGDDGASPNWLDVFHNSITKLCQLSGIVCSYRDPP